MEYIFGASGNNAIGNRKLQVRIGPSIHSLTICNPNDEVTPHFIDSPYFVGHIVVRIKDFRGITPKDQPIKQATEYFGTKKRLFALQVCGRFKHEYMADDIMFGAEFERKVVPPTGSWVALKFANLIDPALQADVYAEKPWLFSPILCSMNIVNVTKSSQAISGAAPLDPAYVKKIGETSVSSKLSSASANPNLLAGPDTSFKRSPESEISMSTATVVSKPSPTELLGEWLWSGSNELVENNTLLSIDDKEATFPSDSISKRRKYYQKAKVRKNTIFRPENIYNFEIFAPFIDLNTFDLNLGISMNLLRYLKRQPLRLMAKSQSKNIYLFVVEFDLVKTSDSDSEELEYDTETPEEEPVSDRQNPLPEEHDDSNRPTLEAA
ncbi:hypothetical protein BATDEDRAFT_34647 [Batrachochytrium dendrobatidis JAM81]|uniref:Domain of unknown function at the cortex 1 domain-containing protein n=2 Tax=Batrachochytrium dendrobatidis TaxID=109871 RepID=F4NXT5_BATDJ|nr:uncharacterized protein BATDEDRAFT_34647 [Batrachochytrium dendrobatidis JAM81]EGF81903.1 hypothetical protein BATDEDRAFT_34647 [Batrachochytrium dendrobatidis JAM81]KAJ8324506.1 hypothetical protein O5D80_006754 [Batrachochytrium dendrobatidis]KAK5670755.1 hypothetical protein QVD99_002526 [Batrachochytrium dendrobatidis]OAJ40574.1 hypothetical protein BDEG_24292 [Batrachochytrium dendrobatidis JEL423]|eukprot:XP_006677438.1 hypothetical protein BATDEDRAFT_34647 [Batrachochytrium dendrobatidis JAM81]